MITGILRAIYIQKVNQGSGKILATPSTIPQPISKHTYDINFKILCCIVLELLSSQSKIRGSVLLRFERVIGFSDLYHLGQISSIRKLQNNVELIFFNKRIKVLDYIGVIQLLQWTNKRKMVASTELSQARCIAEPSMQMFQTNKILAASNAINFKILCCLTRFPENSVTFAKVIVTEF